MPTGVEYLAHLRSTKAHPKQALMIDSPLKRKIIRAGRRSGKTTGVARLAVEQFLKGRRVLYGTPTSDQIQKFWFEVKQALAEPLAAEVYYKNESNHIIELPGKTQRIRAKTCWNADTLRGDYADVLILDEFQLMNEDTWGVVGQPMLIDNNGDALFIYTPASMNSRSATKADDVRHASKMFTKYKNNPKWLCLHFSSLDNPHVSKEGLEEAAAGMSSLAYRQEIMAEDLDQVPGALWTLSLLDTGRISAPREEDLGRIVIGVDPAVTSEPGSDSTGIIVSALMANGHGCVLADLTCRTTPDKWAREIVKAYYQFHADSIVVEVNNGGDLVSTVLHAIDPNLPIRQVHASHGKVARAQPISQLYERGMIHHANLDTPATLAALEDQMCGWMAGTKSPDRLDAAVWAFWDLFPGNMVLGLVDYFASGLAESDMKKSDVQVGKVMKAGALAKPVIADEAPACTECGSTLLQLIGGAGVRCQQCGNQMQTPKVGKPMTRGDWLKENHDVKPKRKISLTGI